MFTSEPSLAQRIERMIGDTPVVDPHSHLRCDRPNAPDLAALMGDRRVGTELIAVGMPPSDLDPTLPADERVRRSIPHLKRMRNTATAWCLYRIFRDLYDFDEPNLTEGNYRDLFDKVAATGEDPGWARAVLVDKAKIRTVVTGLGNKGADGAKDPDFFHYMLEAQDLFGPGVATDLRPAAADRTTRGGFLERLESALMARPTSAEGLDRAVGDWLDRSVTGRVRFTTTSLPIGRRFRPPDPGRVDAILARGGTPADPDFDALADQASWSVLAWHHENRRALQVVVEPDDFASDGEDVAGSRETWASAMARTFRHFSGARFDLMVGSDILARDVAALARQLPNVYAPGDWPHNASLMAIEENVGRRVQVAPMAKVGGFLSDASSAEWAYGRLQVVRKAMAAALARLVDARFFEEDEIPPLLRQILHDTPRDLYGLGVG